MEGIPGVTRHARQRVAERIGRDLTRAEWLALVGDILDGRATLLLRGEEAGEQYAVHVGPMTLRVVWAPDTATLITVLPSLGSAYPSTDAARRKPLGKSLPHRIYLKGKKQKTQWIERREPV